MINPAFYLANLKSKRGGPPRCGSMNGPNTRLTTPISKKPTRVSRPERGEIPSVSWSSSSYDFPPKVRPGGSTAPQKHPALTDSPPDSWTTIFFGIFKLIESRSRSLKQSMFARAGRIDHSNQYVPDLLLLVLKRVRALYSGPSSRHAIFASPFLPRFNRQSIGSYQR